MQSVLRCLGDTQRVLPGITRAVNLLGHVNAAHICWLLMPQAAAVVQTHLQASGTQ